MGYAKSNCACTASGTRTRFASLTVLYASGSFGAAPWSSWLIVSTCSCS